MKNPRSSPIVDRSYTDAPPSIFCPFSASTLLFSPPHLHCFLICSPSLFTFLFFFLPSCISHLPPSFLPFTVCFLTPKCESLSIFRCSSPLPLISLPLSHLLFFLLLKDRFAKALQDSSVLYSSCFLISVMSDNTASGYYIQMCFYKHFLYLYVNRCAAQLLNGKLWER